MDFTTLEQLFQRYDVPTIEKLARQHPEIAARLRLIDQELADAEADYYASVLDRLPPDATDLW